MRLKPRRTPQFDTLEVKAMLSVAGIHAAAAMPTVVTTIPGGATITTVLNLTPGTALPATLVTGLQEDSSGDNTEEFVSQTEVLMGSNANVQAFAASVIPDHRDTNFIDQKVGQILNYIAPSQIQPQDVPTALAALAGVNTGNVDTAYLQAMVAINAKKVAAETQQMGQTTSPILMAFLQSELTSDQMHLTQAQTLLANPNAALNIMPPAAPTGTSNLLTGDQALLTSAYGMSTTDMYEAQLAALVDGQPQASNPVAPYAAQVYQFGQKLTGDHAILNNMLESVAFATNTPLQAGIPTSLAPAVQGILATIKPADPAANTIAGTTLTNGPVKTSDYETTYLTNSVNMHVMLLTAENAGQSTAVDPNLKAVIAGDIPNTYVHLETAITNLSQIQNAELTASYPSYRTRQGAFVVGVYETTLNRFPQPMELQYWVNILNRRGSEASVYKAIASSSEGSKMPMGMTGGMTTPVNMGTTTSLQSVTRTPRTTSTRVAARDQNITAYVDSLYTNVLGTTPDASGEAYWVGRIEHGASRAGVLRAFQKAAKRA